MRPLLAALLFLLPLPAFACDRAADLLRQAYPDAVAGAGGLTLKGGAYAQRIDPDAVACKPWPLRPELTLVAVTLVEANPASEDETRGDVEIIVADTATGKPLARRREEGMAYSDAVQFASLSLDTARYDLKPGLRAFGLRSVQSGSSRVNPFTEQALWLYTYTDGRIDRVLDGLVVERFNGENDGDCAGTSTTTTRGVTIGAAGQGGYRDLLVDQTVASETTRKAGDDCASKVRTVKGKPFRLVFDGHGYEAAKGVKIDRDDLFASVGE
jgi:hypothetical protein